MEKQIMTENLRNSIMLRINEMGCCEIGEKLIAERTEYYDGVLVYDFIDDEVRVEHKPHGCSYAPYGRVIVLFSLRAGKPDDGIDWRELFDEDELKEIWNENAYAGDWERYLAEHPENSFSDRCEAVQMFYFAQNWYETLDKIDQALSGIIKYQDDNLRRNNVQNDS